MLKLNCFAQPVISVHKELQTESKYPDLVFVLYSIIFLFFNSLTQTHSICDCSGIHSLLDTPSHTFVVKPTDRGKPIFYWIISSVLLLLYVFAFLNTNLFSLRVCLTAHKLLGMNDQERQAQGVRLSNGEKNKEDDKGCKC